MKKLLYISILVFLISNTINAQETTVSAGGEASGNGVVSYSVGQIVYSAQTGANGNTISEEVQQPYEISIVTEIAEAQNINLNITVYPNPTTEYLIIDIDNYKSTNIKYLIFDINGKLLQSIESEGKITKIETSNLIPSNYFLRVLDKDREIKVFKIIKN